MTDTKPVVLIRPSRGWRALDLAEMWRYRELVYFISLRDVKLRYKQTLFGVGWAVIQPLVAMGIFALFLGRFVQLPSDGIPYALFAFVGLLPWIYFAGATTIASGSLLANRSLIEKVYFPRLVIPVAGVTTPLIDLFVGLVAAGILLAVFGWAPAPYVVFLPLFLALALLTALAVSIWLSAIDVQYRDVRYALPFLTQVWLFATPVVYPASIVPAEIRPWYGLNPMAGVVEGVRWSVLGRGEPPGLMLAVSVAVVLIVLVGGLLYFRRMERSFADVI